METLVPSITGLTPAQETDGGNYGGNLNLSGQNIEGLKPGIFLNVSLQSGLDGLVTSVKLENGNQLFQIPVKINITLPATEGQTFVREGYPAEIKITAVYPENASFKVVNINGLKPEKFIQSVKAQMEKVPSFDEQPIVNNINTRTKPEIRLHALNLRTIAGELSPQKLQEGEIVTVFKGIAPSKVIMPETEAIIQNIKEAVRTQNWPEMLLETQKLTGKILPADTIVRPDVNVTGFKTSLGEVISAVPLRIEEHTPVELLVKSVTLPPVLFQEDNAGIMSLGTQLIDELMGEQTSLRTTPLPQISVEQMQDKLKSSALPPEIKAEVMTKLPALNNGMLSNLVNYVKAAAHQNVEQWLGTGLVERLSASGAEGQEALHQLTTVLNSSLREQQLWRIIEIPFFNGEQTDKISLAVKKYGDEEQETPNGDHQKYGTRFVVETNFTRLGRFQFDGYSLKKDKHFDLIVRTERSLSKGFCANMMRIFTNTLHDVGYAGTIKINVNENFIKIGDNAPKESSSTGILI